MSVHTDLGLESFQAIQNTSANSPFSAAMNTEVDPIPTPETLSKAGSGELYDKEGNKTTFSEITKDHRVLIIFIRHFCKPPPCPHSGTS